MSQWFWVNRVFSLRWLFLKSLKFVIDSSKNGGVCLKNLRLKFPTYPIVHLYFFKYFLELLPFSITDTQSLRTCWHT